MTSKLPESSARHTKLWFRSRVCLLSCAANDGQRQYTHLVIIALRSFFSCLNQNSSHRRLRELFDPRSAAGLQSNVTRCAPSSSHHFIICLCVGEWLLIDVTGLGLHWLAPTTAISCRQLTPIPSTQKSSISTAQSR